MMKRFSVCLVLSAAGLLTASSNQARAQYGAGIGASYQWGGGWYYLATYFADVCASYGQEYAYEAWCANYTSAWDYYSYTYTDDNDAWDGWSAFSYGWTWVMYASFASDKHTAYVLLEEAKSEFQSAYDSMQASYDAFGNSKSLTARDYAAEAKYCAEFAQMVLLYY